MPNDTFIATRGPTQRHEGDGAGRGRLLATALLAGGIGVFVLTLLLLALEQLQSFALAGHDLAIFVQSMTSAAHGGPLRNSIEIYGLVMAGGGDRASGLITAGGVSHLAAHWSPILFLFAPLYRLASDPLALQALQVLALALTSLPIYHLARRRFADRRVALVAGLACLVQPLALLMGLSEFHENALAAPLLPLLVLTAEQPRWWPFAVTLALCLAIKEDTSLVVLCLGVGLFLGGHRPRGLAAAGAAAASLLAGALVMHAARDGVPSEHLLRFTHLGASPLEILGSPGRALRLLLARQDAAYLHLLVPWLLLPLASPYALLALPVLAMNLLSNRLEQHVPMSHANLLLLPILAIAAVDGLSRLQRLLRRRVPSAGGRALAAGAAGVLLGSGLVLWLYLPGVQQHLRSPLTAAEQEGARRLMATVPPCAPLMASPRFLPALGDRTTIFPPEEIPGFSPDYLLLFAQEPLWWPFHSRARRDAFVLGMARRAKLVDRAGRVFLFALPGARTTCTASSHRGTRQNGQMASWRRGQGSGGPSPPAHGPERVRERVSD